MTQHHLKESYNKKVRDCIGHSYYRATITCNDRIVSALKGRFNTKEQLDKWLDGSWPHSLAFTYVAAGKNDLVLTVHEYWGVHRKGIWLRAVHPC